MARPRFDRVPSSLNTGGGAGGGNAQGTGECVCE